MASKKVETSATPAIVLTPEEKADKKRRSKIVSALRRARKSLAEVANLVRIGQVAADTVIQEYIFCVRLNAASAVREANSLTEAPGSTEE